MKRKLQLTFVAISLCLFGSVSAQGWGNLGIGEYPMVLNENFQDWTKNHTVATQEEITLGGNGALSTKYFDGDITIPVYDRDGKTGESFYLTQVQCAAAPGFMAQYYYDDSKTAYSKYETSLGFLELGRTEYSGAATEPGVLIIPKIDMLEGIQYSYSSVGGNKRGFVLSKSLDNGTTWEIVRQETGNITTSTSGTNVEASGYGLRFEDIFWEENVMLKFDIYGGQVLRIHDIRLYGELTPGGNSIGGNSADSFEITNSKEYVYLTTVADVELYSISGKLMKSEDNTDKLSIGDLPKGVYVAKAQSADGAVVTKKILK